MRSSGWIVSSDMIILCQRSENHFGQTDSAGIDHRFRLLLSQKGRKLRFANPAGKAPFGGVQAGMAQHFGEEGSFQFFSLGAKGRLMVGEALRRGRGGDRVHVEPFQQIFSNIAGVGKQPVSLLPEKGRRPTDRSRCDMTAIALPVSAFSTMPARPAQGGVAGAESDEAEFLQFLEQDEAEPGAEPLLGWPPLVPPDVEVTQAAQGADLAGQIDPVVDADPEMCPAPPAGGVQSPAVVADIAETVVPSAMLTARSEAAAQDMMLVGGADGVAPAPEEARRAATFLTMADTGSVPPQAIIPELSDPASGMKIGRTASAAPEAAMSVGAQADFAGDAALPDNASRAVRRQNTLSDQLGTIKAGESERIAERQLAVQRPSAPSVQETALRLSTRDVDTDTAVRGDGREVLGSTGEDATVLPSTAQLEATPTGAPDVPALPIAKAVVPDALPQPDRLSQTADRPLPIKTAEGPILPVLTSAISNGSDRIELRLDPAELGRVMFEMTTERGQLHLIVTCERAETMDLLRRHADQLLQDLREAGFSNSTLDFSEQAASQQRKDAPNAQASGREDADAAPAAPPAQSAYGRHGAQPDGGLDLRL